MKYTKGPWILKRRDGGIDAPIAWDLSEKEFGLAIWMPAAPFAFGKLGALIPTVEGMEEAEANAKLIAAAPEMFEALKRIAAAGLVIPVDQKDENAERFCREFLAAYDMAQKAIKKAEEGKS